MSTPSIEKVMEVYKHKQTDLANDIGGKPYQVCRWIKRGLVPAEFILKVIKAAIKRDISKKLGTREDLALSFLRDHQRKAVEIINNKKV